MALNSISSLEDRRTRGDPIQMIKIVNRHEKINLMKDLNLTTSLNLNLRRKHNMKPDLFLSH
ncbi:hypothetical protein BpHYR1_039494, partial [Brachionus plicatilis]